MGVNQQQDTLEGLEVPEETPEQLQERLDREERDLGAYERLLHQLTKPMYVWRMAAPAGSPGVPRTSRGIGAQKRRIEALKDVRAIVEKHRRGQ